MMTGRYQSYPEYKNSGKDWLQKIPRHWISTTIKYGYNVTLGKMLQKKANSPTDHKKPYLKAANIQPNGLSFDNVQMMWFSEAELESLRLKSEDVLITEGGDVGRAAIWRNELPECYFQNAINRARPLSKSSSKFLYYWISFLKDTNYIDIICNKATIAHYTAEKVEVSPLFLPSLKEALKISSFLDYETARINTLIEKQQQLIKLLQEKRQAVISHAVTKGLNPDAPMHDSGIEWLGEVPQHWKLIPLKYLCTFCGGGTPSKDKLEYWTDGNIPWVSPKDMKKFWLVDTTDKLTEKAVEESSTNFVDNGALLMVVRSGILQRKIPIAINRVRVTLNQDMKALKFNSQMNVEYAANYILGFQDSLLLEWSKEGATVESIEHEYLSTSQYPVPPIEEQEQINVEIQKRIDAFNKLKKKAEHAIELMRERRTALISAAVTGKIDVRDWQPPGSCNSDPTE